jgi:glycosyltransferase involved in cell wall biosynthesis
VGRLIEEQKRISRLVELARLLSDRDVNFHLTIVGTGPQKELVVQESRRSRAITYKGELPNHVVQALLNEQDVMVLLSDYEGLPLSLIEAMGAGVVPVVSDLESGIRDIVDDASGIRVPAGDVASAAAAVASLAQDRKRLFGMSAQARKVRSAYSAAHMAQRYWRFVDELSPATRHWPSTATVPVPLGMNPWLYDGMPRIARRWIKRLLSVAARG